MRNTVAKAEAIKTAVATNERGDRRASSQTPWPLVQPDPSRAPKPTRRPAIPSVAAPDAMRGAFCPKGHARGQAPRQCRKQPEAPYTFSAPVFERARENADRAKDAASAEDEQRRRRADQYPAEKRRIGSEMGGIDGHRGPDQTISLIEISIKAGPAAGQGPNTLFVLPAGQPADGSIAAYRSRDVVDNRVGADKLSPFGNGPPH